MRFVCSIVALGVASAAVAAGDPPISAKELQARLLEVRAKITPKSSHWSSREPVKDKAPTLLGLLYFECLARDLPFPPKSIDDLKKAAAVSGKEYAEAVSLVETGKYIYIYGVLLIEPNVDAARTIIAYEASTPEKGGIVITIHGVPRRISAEEFAAAAKGKSPATEAVETPQPRSRRPGLGSRPKPPSRGGRAGGGGMKKSDEVPPEKDPSPTKSTKRPIPTPQANADGLLDTATTNGRKASRGAFREVGPEGSVLVGFRYWKGSRYGGCVAALAPIYRAGAKTSVGETRGNEQGESTDVVAKEGYAVGAVDGHSGAAFDSLVLVFMRVDGEKLDASDSYRSSAMGKSSDASLRKTVDGDGRLVRGVIAEVRSELVGIGLVLAPK